MAQANAPPCHRRGHFNEKGEPGNGREGRFRAWSRELKRRDAWEKTRRACKEEISINKEEKPKGSGERKEKLKDFAAIDFETANKERTSVCSVGVVIVRDGAVADSFYSLIRPKPNYYTFTWLHGIAKEATRDAPLFPEVWEKAAVLIGELPLVAHNSPFDEGCLKAAFELYGMDYPGYRFYCTCRASRTAFGSKLPNHKLATVAAHCGYDLQNHHNALADAEACAHIAMKIL